jgi:hypothetical protein
VKGARGRYYRLPGIDQGKDVGMLQVGGEPDLAEKALRAEPGGELRPEQLDRDGAVVLEVAREVDGSHAAAAELPLDAVAVGEGRLQMVGDHCQCLRTVTYVFGLNCYPCPGLFTGELDGCVLESYAFASPERGARLSDALKKLRIVLQAIIQPVLLGLEANEDARGLSVAGDHNFLPLGQPEIL